MSIDSEEYEGQDTSNAVYVDGMIYPKVAVVIEVAKELFVHQIKTPGLSAQDLAHRAFELAEGFYAEFYRRYDQEVPEDEDGVSE
jgi:hypothetical protein